MFTKITENYAIADDVILSYVGKENKVVISASCDGNPIKKIGAGAFCGNERITDISIEEGIESIGEKAFSMMPKLEKIHLPATVEQMEEDSFSVEKWDMEESLRLVTIERYLTDEELHKIQNTGLLMADGRYLMLKKHEDIVCLDMLYKSIDCRVQYPVMLTSDMEKIFRLENGKRTIAFDFYSQDKWTNEEDAFLERISRDSAGPSNKLAEEVNDTLAKRGSEVKLQKTGILLLQADGIHKENSGKYEGLWKATFEYHFGYFFWQGFQKICIHGEYYYVYIKKFINPDEGCPYIRMDRKMDIQVYDKSGLVREKETIDRIYGRYKLLTML